MYKELRIIKQTPINVHHVSTIHRNRLFWLPIFYKYKVTEKLEDFPLLHYWLLHHVQDVSSTFYLIKNRIEKSLKDISIVQKKLYENVNYQNLLKSKSSLLKITKPTSSFPSFKHITTIQREINYFYSKDLHNKKIFKNELTDHIKKELEAVSHNKETFKNEKVENLILAKNLTLFQHATKLKLSLLNDNLLHYKSNLLGAKTLHQNNTDYTNINDAYHKNLQYHTIDKQVLTQSNKEDKILHNFLQNSLELKSLVPNITRLKSSFPSFKKHLIENFKNISIVHKKLYQNNKKLYKNIDHRHALNSETSLLNTTRLKPSFPNFRNHSLYKFNENEIYENISHVYPNGLTQNSTETTMIHSIEQSNHLSKQVTHEPISKKTIYPKEAIQKSAVNHTQPSMVENHINHMNPHEIKTLAKKIYPILMNQWQKEFEKRGVFYG